MECEFYRTPYKKDWTTTRGVSTSQPRRNQESTRRTPSGWSSGELEDACRSIRTPAVLGHEELGACQTQTHGIVHVAHFLRIRDGT
jgi:hypothetical protein